MCQSVALVWRCAATIAHRTGSAAYTQVPQRRQAQERLRYDGLRLWPDSIGAARQNDRRRPDSVSHRALRVRVSTEDRPSFSNAPIDR